MAGVLTGGRATQLGSELAEASGTRRVWPLWLPVRQHLILKPLFNHETPVLGCPSTLKLTTARQTTSFLAASFLDAFALISSPSPSCLCFIISGDSCIAQATPLAVYDHVDNVRTTVLEKIFLPKKQYLTYFRLGDASLSNVCL